MGIFTRSSSEFYYELRENIINDENSMYDIFMESIDDDMQVIKSMCMYDRLEMQYNHAISEAYDDYDKNRIASEKQFVLENSFGDTMNKIKESIKKFFTTILNWFKGIIDRLRALIMDSETFVKKFGNRIRSANIPSGGLTVTAYKYNEDNIFRSVFDDIKKYNSGADDTGKKLLPVITSAKTKDDIKRVEKQILNLKKNLNMTDSNRSEKMEREIFDSFYGDGAKEKGKQEYKINNVSRYLSYIEKSGKVLNEIVKEQTAISKEADNIIRDINDMSKDIYNKTDDIYSDRIKCLNDIISLVKVGKNILIRVLNVKIGALRSYINFSKFVCLKAIKRTE